MSADLPLLAAMASAVQSFDEAQQALRRVFGFEQFRGVQQAVIERVLAGESTLAVMPTGAGKSLTYQLPATMLQGTCVVISPLIALMHDQLRAARANGIRAATLTSVDEDRAATVAAFRAGELDLSAPASRISASCWAPRRWRCSRWTRRTAYPNGGTISAPTIASCGR